MRPIRIHLLLALLAILVIARTAFPPGTGSPAVVEPVERIAPAPLPPRSETVAMSRTPSALPESAAAPVATDDVPGNAFRVRAVPVSLSEQAAASVPPRPPPPASPPVTPVAAVPVGPAVAPAPQLRIIGTWDDGSVPAVFVATPTGTVIARKGSMLLSVYQVTEVTEQAVSLVHTATKQVVMLPIAAVTVGR